MPSWRYSKAQGIEGEEDNDDGLIDELKNSLLDHEHGESPRGHIIEQQEGNRALCMHTSSHDVISERTNSGFG